MNLPDIEANQNPLYILLDGAVIEDAAKLSYELAANQDIEIIYSGTVLNIVANLSPIILPLKNNQVLLNAAMDKKPHDWGIVFEAEASTSDVADHLKTVIKADLGNGSTSVFRFYLPHVVGRIALASTDTQKHRLFGPITKIWSQSRADKIWETTEITYFEKPPQEENIGWMALSDNQLTALGEAAKQHFHYRALDHVNQHFPKHFYRASPQDQLLKIESYVKQGQSYGLSSEMESLCFINILCMLGEEALEGEKHSDVKKLLDSKDTMLPSERIQNALNKATELYEHRESLNG
ncbi:hypothetical protein A1OO_11135 [Enterovibrio norvegicus FF-33]|uniref:DUF4123 domain-containing protein n=1 Tax=Enterovibrio norvegicus TaxID=188144 RepID=UPI00030ED19C|nr:DUF4123 domain-containing protein [Enterovibrio norvegicus]OEE66333.1 hypothetical protein A1OO_11135 [Enterovibrio norvegicus FF-33]